MEDYFNSGDMYDKENYKYTPPLFTQQLVQGDYIISFNDKVITQDTPNEEVKEILGMYYPLFKAMSIDTI